MTTAVAMREQEMKRALMGEALRREIEMALPRHVPVERFQRVLMTSVVHDDKLAAVAPLKVVKAALKVAPLGLLTDPLLGEAYLIADNRGDVQVRIGYRGLIKLARQSDQIAAIYAHEVYERDEIECVLGDKKRLHHKPQLFGDRGEIVGYYAVVKFLNGETDFEPMTVEQINKIRAKSDSWRAFKNGKIKDTPWESAYDEMAKKTVLRRLLKRVPASPDLQDAILHEAEADQREYGNGEALQITAADRRAAMQETEAELVEVTDADGEVHLVMPGEVKQFLRDNPGAAVEGNGEPAPEEPPELEPAPPPAKPAKRATVTKAEAQAICTAFDECKTPDDYWDAQAEHQAALNALQERNGPSWETVDSHMTKARKLLGMEFPMSDLDQYEGLPPEGEGDRDEQGSLV